MMMPFNNVHGPATAVHPNAFPLSVVSADGHLIAVTRLGSSVAPVSVVYLHGIGTDATYWTPLTTDLHHRLGGGIAQIAYDQTGHGITALRGRPATIETQIEDLDAVINATGTPVVLVAHSLAALTVTAWVDRHPEKARDLAGVVLLNATSTLPEPTRPLRRGLGPLGRREARRDRRVVADLRAHAYHDLPDRAPQWWPRRTRAMTIRELRPTTAAMLDLLDAYAAVEPTVRACAVLRGCPCWIHAGGTDALVPVDAARKFAEQLWADFEIVPDAGHCLPYREPEAAAAPILACLEVAYLTAARSSRAEEV